LEFVQ